MEKRILGAVLFRLSIAFLKEAKCGVTYKKMRRFLWNV